MKKISILIPCYNEVENVGPISQAVTDILKNELPQYDYELVFIDNDSTDGTREVLRTLCSSDPKIKAIFNARNFGQFNSPYYGMLQVTGDCVIEMVADFQDPVEMIPKYVREWEIGYKIVIGIKTSSQENKFMYWLRTCSYKTIKKLSAVEQIEHFTGSGLYDREFIEILRKLDDPTPFLRGIVAELGYKRKEIPYEQPKRRAGKTHNNFYRLYDAAMLSVTSYTKEGLRLATIFGGVCAAGSMIIALIYLVMKLIWWDRFPAGMAPMLIGMLFLGSHSATSNGVETIDYGHDFNVRPNAFEFYYKFKSLNSESFEAYIVVENRENGTVTQLGSGRIMSNQDQASFAPVRVNVHYTNTSLKATHMYIVFRSSTADNPSVEGVQGSLGAFDGYSDSRYVGNVLTIDNVRLIYE